MKSNLAVRSILARSHNLLIGIAKNNMRTIWTLGSLLSPTAFMLISSILKAFPPNFIFNKFLKFQES